MLIDIKSGIEPASIFKNIKNEHGMVDKDKILDYIFDEFPDINSVVIQLIRMWKINGAKYGVGEDFLNLEFVQILKKSGYL